MTGPGELAEEQAYFDEAADCRERMRSGLLRAPGATAHQGAAVRVKRAAEEAVGRMRGPDEAVAFGRVDTENNEIWYVGYNAVHNDDSDILVVSWKAPIASPYFEATYADPKGVTRRRDFECRANTIVDFQDLLFTELAEEIAALEDRAGLRLEPKVSDSLLEDLQRNRTGEMRDIVRTIQVAQFEIIREALDQLLVVQGGPGTGKTVVALHRLSWLLYNHAGTLDPQRTLVGPNPTFVRYIRRVLPSLGDDDVQQRSLSGLGPPVRLGRIEEPQVTRLKGHLRMTGLIDRGLRNRIDVPDGRLEVQAGAVPYRFDREEVSRQVQHFQALTYAAGRQQLRNHLRQLVVERPDAIAPDEGQLDALLDRIWPQLTPQAFLRDLFGSEGRLLRAAGEEFTAAEVGILYRRASERLADESWALADVPILDYANFRINGLREQFDHIVVDEAQDLSPMELGAIGRRSSTVSMTILGDLAQSTGPWARDSWADIVEMLRTADVPTKVVELEYGYRVPRQIYEFAARLLPKAAPGLRGPRVIRDGPAGPERVLVEADDLADRVVGAAQAHTAKGLLVGVIAPAVCREAIVEAFGRHEVAWTDARTEGIGGPISLLSAADSKGLEFDATVVVEPAAIVQEDERGERLLYVALTRATRYLTVVHTGIELPVDESASPGGLIAATQAITVPGEQVRSQTVDRGSPLDRLATAIAKQLADEIRHSVQSNLWPNVLRELDRMLALADDSNEPEGGEDA